MRHGNTNNTTTKDIVYKALRDVVYDNKAVTGLDASTFSVAIAVQYGLNPNTVDRCRRRYIADRLAQDLIGRENKAFSIEMDKFNKS